MRILPLSGWTSDESTSCTGFTDAIEREIGYPAEPTRRTLPVPQSEIAADPTGAN